jgi:predicted dehydrogenase
MRAGRDRARHCATVFVENLLNAKPAATPIRAGLIGYGYAGRTFPAPLIMADSGLRLSVVCSRDAARVHADLPDVEVEADPERMARHPEVDLVVIAAPNAVHASLADAALRAGKHVVVDKPFVLDLTEARALLRAAKASGTVLSVFQNRRWDSDFQAVHEAIACGRIGRVVHFESHIDRFRPQVRERWREQPVPGAGLAYDLGPHLIDQALLLFGLPDSVNARQAIQRNGGSVDDWMHLMLDYGPLQVILHAGMLAAGGLVRFTVHGTRGSLVKKGADVQESQLRAGMAPGASGWGQDPDPLQQFNGDADVAPVERAAPVGDYRKYYAGLCEAIKGHAANPVEPIQALAVMAVLEAARTSSRTRSDEPLALTADEAEAARRAFPGQAVQGGRMRAGSC